MRVVRSFLIGEWRSDANTSRRPREANRGRQGIPVHASVATLIELRMGKCSEKATKAGGDYHGESLGNRIPK